METIHKIGRRKTAVARIYLSKGKGNITVNKKDYKDYFSTDTLQYKILQPLNLTDNATAFDIKAKVFGGGVTRKLFPIFNGVHLPALGKRRAAD
jgi:small subunit ribosomal protein S9